MSEPWPDLPVYGFIVGRPATANDVREGNAVFHTNGTGGAAAAILIPQFAYWTEVEDRKPVVLIQAEHAPQEDKVLVGLRDFAGQTIIGTLGELELLGQKKPQ